MNKELESDIVHLTANLSYFSDIELGRYMREVLQREIEKTKRKEINLGSIKRRGKTQ